MSGLDGASSGPEPEAARLAFVTATIAGQLFGLPIQRVHDVFTLGALTPVPLAPPEIRGLMNLRGRIVTAIDLRHRLGVEPAPIEAGGMAIGLDADEDGFGLVVDQIGEIVTVAPEAVAANPIHLDPAWAELSQGVCQLDGDLLVILDADTILDPRPARPHPSRSLESPQ